MNPRICPLELGFDPSQEPTSDRAHALGTIRYGVRTHLDRESGTLEVALPPLLADEGAEVWWSDSPPRRAQREGFAVAETDGVLFGATALEEPDPERAAAQLYERLFALLDASPFPHLLRIWNVVPRIGETSGGLDRYMRYCSGRARAFERHHGAGFEARLPAASAVGSEDGAFALWFLASREPGRPRENPRQTSAFRYPERYGPRPPSFTRATEAPPELGGDLLLSGTASIVGADSVHLDDRAAQLAETMENVRVLLGERARLDAGDLRSLKVFVRDPRDAASIRDELVALVGPEVELLFLRADICRPELMLEIEGVGRRVRATGPVSAATR